MQFFVLLEDQGLPEEVFVIQKRKKKVIFHDYGMHNSHNYLIRVKPSCHQATDIIDHQRLPLTMKGSENR